MLRVINVIPLTAEMLGAVFEFANGMEGALHLRAPGWKTQRKLFELRIALQAFTTEKG
jgi:hypothetical protein